MRIRLLLRYPHRFAQTVRHRLVHVKKFLVDSALVNIITQAYCITKSVFSFPRPDLENRWWHRFFKVVTFIATVFLFFILWGWANAVFRPYYVFSSQPDFHKYAGTVKKLSDVSTTSRDNTHLVVAFRCSGHPADEYYIANLD